jgi:hypothetical protein
MKTRRYLDRGTYVIENGGRHESESAELEQRLDAAQNIALEKLRPRLMQCGCVLFMLI